MEAGSLKIGRLLVLGLGGLAFSLGCENVGRAVNSPCETNTDCASQICHNGICASKDPKDNGSTCKGDGECKSFRCVNGACRQGERKTGRCKDNAECASNNCEINKCAPAVSPDGGADSAVPDQALPDKSVPDQTLPTCTDKIKNGDETDVDCGGKTCLKCKDAKGCKKVTDCLSGICTGNKCIKGCVHQPVVKDCYKDKGGIEWCRIPAGCFMMGSPTTEACHESCIGKETQHQVTLTHGLELQHTEVTLGQFKALMGYNPSEFGPNGTTGNKGKCAALDCPVERVSWHEMTAYCNALSKQSGLTPCYADQGSGKTCTTDKYCGSKEVCQNKTSCIRYEPGSKFVGQAIYTCEGYRLPTEAEWEYAYRAGTTTAYYSGKNVGSLCKACSTKDTNADSIGWYCYNASKQTHEVGKKTANAWGLHGQAGNVREWCHDEYLKDLGTAEAIDPVVSGSYRVLRGGSWGGDARHMRAVCREGHAPVNRGNGVGFRCVRSSE